MARWLYGNLSRLFTSITLALVLALSAGASQALALDNEELTNISVYEKAAPAVVTLTVTMAEGPSSGAGAIIDPSGIVLTSSHVIGDAQTVRVTLDSGDEYSARVLARIGEQSDLALLKIQADRTFPFIKMGNSDALRVGQKVLAIGHPYGFDRTLTLGIVSRLDKERNRIQTDASINPGNSGGPLLNTSGEMIGVSQSIFNPEGRRTNIGIGFAVPIDTAKTFIRELATLPAPRHHATEVTTEVQLTSGQDIPVLLKEFSKQLN